VRKTIDLAAAVAPLVERVPGAVSQRGTGHFRHLEGAT
jgi:hypothetical protein